MSDNISQHCEPCSYGRNVTIDATQYCSECEESYCQACSLAHKAPRATKNHKLVNIEECLDKTSLYCEPCSENGDMVTAVSRCVECTESYCENCARIHKSQKATRKHEIITIDLEKMRSICEACSFSGEEDRPSSAMCFTCDEALCVDCTRVHRSQRATRTHQIENQDDQNISSPRLETGRSSARGKLCDRCSERNKITVLDEAFWFCFSCRQTLCEICASDHKTSVEESIHRLIYSSETETKDESKAENVESPKSSSYESLQDYIEKIGDQLKLRRFRLNEIQAAKNEIFIDELSTMNTKSLSQSKEVLEKRKKIEETAGVLLSKVEKGLNKLEECRSEIAVLEKYKAQMLDNKDFKYKRKKHFHNVIPLEKGFYTTNCLHCNVTCHDNCTLADDENTAQCVAMDGNGFCMVCEDHCYWDKHKSTPFIIQWIEVEEECTYDAMMKKYQAAEAEVISHEAIVDKMKKELDDAENEMLNLIKEIADCCNQLSQMALRANPLSVAEHIDIIIENEKWERKPGFQDRINNLENFIKKIVVGDEFKHFQKCKEDIYK